MNRVNPEMIVLARESRGYTQGALADALGATQGQVSKMEAGLLGVHSEHLKALSRVLAYPPEFFVQTDAVYGYGSTCLYHRKRQSLPAKDLKRIIAELNVLRIGVQKLLRSVELKPAREFPRMDLADYESSPGYIAQLLRGVWGLPRGPVVNVVRTIENAGGVVMRCSFGTKKLDAMSQWPPGSPPLFFVNSESPCDRTRFSLAHELGHLIMHQIPTVNLEPEADVFAAEFLMPAKEIRPQLTNLSLAKLAQLKPLWRVSMAALAKRGFDLGTVSKRHYRTLFTQMGKAGIRVHEPVPLSLEEPELLKHILDVHRKRYGYSLTELSGLTGMLEPEFKRRYLSEVSRLSVVRS